MWMAVQSATETLFALPARAVSRARDAIGWHAGAAVTGQRAAHAPGRITRESAWGWPGGEVISLRMPIARLIPGDGELAQSLYERRFGAKLAAEDWRLGWLKHFAATGKILHTIYALDVLDRMAHSDRMPLDSHGASKALLALSWDGPELLQQAGQSASANLFTLATRLARMVYGSRPVTANDALLRAASLVSATLAFRGLESIQKSSVDSFCRSLQDVIRSDGSHRSDRADELLRLTLVVLPITAAMIETSDTVPEDLRLAVDRMLPALRAMTLGDGGLTCLHKGGPHREAVKAVLDAAGLNPVPAEPYVYAPDAEIASLRQATTALVIDCAANAFEISHGAYRLCLVETLSPRRMPTTLTDHMASPEGSVIRLGNELGTRKTIFLAASGSDLRCEENVEAEEELRIMVPDSAEVEIDKSAPGLRLCTSDGAHWQLTQRGGTVSIVNKTIIIIPASVPGRINWALKKV